MLYLFSYVLFQLIFGMLLQIIVMTKMINSKESMEVLAGRVTELVLWKGYKRVVLQMGKEMLKEAFGLVNQIQRKCSESQFFVLFDSMKQSCCLDVLGAEHVNYDCLLHFGQACFSEEYQPHHHYFFNPSNSNFQSVILQTLTNPSTLAFLDKNRIGYVMVEQKYYQLLKEKVFSQCRMGSVQLLRLPFDRQEKDQYLAFGYYGRVVEKDMNILVVEEASEEESQQMNLASKVTFVLKGLKAQIGQSVFQFDPQSHQINCVNANHNKLLMQRMSLISQLQSKEVFGLIVSNTSAAFQKQTVQRCKQLLMAQGKRVFTFLMNNLNEVKLGNFPQIQAYVIISCHNHSLYTLKDFHKLTVTPNDLEVAFCVRPFDQYALDCASEHIFTVKEEPKDEKVIQEEKEEKARKTEQLAKVGPYELELQERMQTLQFYRSRQFKGLQFKEKKQVKKMGKGKIGLAESYQPLQ